VEFMTAEVLREMVREDEPTDSGLQPASSNLIEGCVARTTIQTSWISVAAPRGFRRPRGRQSRDLTRCGHRFRHRIGSGLSLAAARRFVEAEAAARNRGFALAERKAQVFCSRGRQSAVDFIDARTVARRRRFYASTLARSATGVVSVTIGSSAIWATTLPPCARLRVTETAIEVDAIDFDDAAWPRITRRFIPT